jgi:hypothetical protein
VSGERPGKAESGYNRLARMAGPERIPPVGMRVSVNGPVPWQ